MGLITRRTTCSRDCPDTCTLLVSVDAQGRAVKLKGSPEDPVTQGFLCERTSRFLYRQNSPDRFTTPMWRPRKGAELEPVSWDFALDLCARRLLECRAQHGPASVLHYRSGGSLGLLKQLSDVLFEAFGPVTLKRGDICSGAGEAAQEADFGICDSHDLFDLRNSRAIVLWSKNVHTSGPHLLPMLMDAKARGVRIVGVDCTRTRLASSCDHFIQPQPGSDFALMMAVAHAFLERSPVEPGQFCDFWPEFQAMVRRRSPERWAEMAGVATTDVQVLVDAFALRPCAVQVGWGMGRRRSGGATIRALDALAAISGNLGISGGGVSYYYRRRSAFDGPDLGGLEAAPRSFSEACLGREILAARAPEVHLVWVTAGNPASMLPDSATVRRALTQVETVVVVDTHPTDTTDLADLVLPTLTLLEDDDLLGAYGNHLLRTSQPALEPPGEARHELWIWQRLGERLGLDQQLLEGTPRQWKERMMVRLGQAGVDLERLEQGPVQNPFAEKVLFEDLRFPTATGKMQLIHEEPEILGTDPDYPFQLAAFSTPKSQCSQWSVPLPEIPVARIHPGSAPQLRAGQTVQLETRRGTQTVTIELDESVHPRMILLAKGVMRRQGGSPNALIEARETDMGGGACYYDEPVRYRILP